MPRRCSATSASVARMSPVTRPGRSSPSSWPSTVPTSCTRWPCWSRRSAWCAPERRGLLREGGTCAGGVRRGRPRGGDGGVPERGVQPRLGDLPDGDREARPRRRGAGDAGRRHLLRQLPAGPQRLAVRARAGGRHLPAGAVGAGHGDRAAVRGRPRAAPRLVPAGRGLHDRGRRPPAAHAAPEPVAQGVAEFFARHPMARMRITHRHAFTCVARITQSSRRRWWRAKLHAAGTRTSRTVPTCSGPPMRGSNQRTM